MLYPDNISLKLGFDQILQLLKDRCKSSLGLELVDKIRFSSKYDLVVKLLNQTAEFQTIITAEESLPANYFIDVRSYLNHAKVEGTFLQEDQFKEVSRSLSTIKNVSGFLLSRKSSYPYLNTLFFPQESIFHLIDDIDDKIDDDKCVKDSATPELSRIRKSLSLKHRQVRKSLQQEFDAAAKSGFIPEGASITVRDGRMVIPLLAEYKRRVKGFVQDESATGQTVFLEPASVLEGNNELRELEYAEKRETIKILTEMTDRLRLELDALIQAYKFLSFIDFIQAKARLAIDLGATLPRLHDEQLIHWENARHPLLYISHAAINKSVVPLSISLNSEKRILVISGPNAGGKSVCLKTIGLLQMMLQCGLLVPVSESSKFGLFEDVFIDIGDEQSIENDLSTYSSHLSNMKHFMKQGGGKSLILIDEFGTGTDPQFGGAIAEAILKELDRKAVFGAITTHYSNIKTFAENSEYLINGAMKYDMANLQPLYELDLGKPGSSFSLEIARKIGISHHVINNAKELIGSQTIDLDALLLKLERQKQKTNERERTLKAKEKKISRLEARYERLVDELEKDKKQIINKAKAEAASLLKDTNRAIERTIRHIKENKAQKGETLKARNRLAGLKGKMEVGEAAISKVQPISGQIGVGDMVRIVGQEVAGEVIAIRGKGAEVKFGDLKSTVKIDRLEKVSKTVSKKINKAVSSGINLNQKMAEFSSTLDVRGKRAEEVFSIVDSFMDSALLFGRNEVRILHGKGDGILRQIIRDHLKNSSYINAVRDEHIERGGAGITVIELK